MTNFHKITHHVKTGPPTATSRFPHCWAPTRCFENHGSPSLFEKKVRFFGGSNIFPDVSPHIGVWAEVGGGPCPVQRAFQIRAQSDNYCGPQLAWRAQNTHRSSRSVMSHHATPPQTPPHAPPTHGMSRRYMGHLACESAPL